MPRNHLHPNPDIADEFAAVELPESRLEDRLDKIVPVLEAHPDKSFPDGFADESELAAFYRFIENQRIDPEALLDHHAHRTAERASNQADVYLISDSSLVVRNRPDADEKFLNITDTKYGFGIHTVLAVTGQHRAVPLGVVSTEIFEPAPFPAEMSRRQRQQSPNRPSLRWLRGIERAAEATDAEDVSAIHVMDREADSYEIWAHLAQLDQRAIIRSRFDRQLVADSDTSDQTLRERVADHSVLTRLELDLGPRRTDPSDPPATLRRYPARKARQATVELRLARVEVPRPARKPDDWPDSIELWAVHLHEPHPPEDEEPIDWLLLANYPVQSLRQALEIVRGYRARWTIEEYHKVLKTGCSLEERQLHSVETFEPTVRLFAPISWKLLLATRLHRQFPGTSAGVVFDDYELTALRILSRQKRRDLPARLSVKRAYQAIAKLGGWLQKPSRHPGWLVLTRGMQKVEDAANILREVGIDSPPP